MRALMVIRAKCHFKELEENHKYGVKENFCNTKFHEANLVTQQRYAFLDNHSYAKMVFQDETKFSVNNHFKSQRSYVR